MNWEQFKYNFLHDMYHAGIADIIDERMKVKVYKDCGLPSEVISIY